MTPNEMKFALMVESALNSLTEPEYRQLMIELLMVLGQLLIKYQPQHLKNDVLQLDLVITEANECFLENQVSFISKA